MSEAKRYEPFPDAIPEGWPSEFVAASDYDKLEALLRDAAAMIEDLLADYDPEGLFRGHDRVISASRDCLIAARSYLNDSLTDTKHHPPAKEEK